MTADGIGHTWKLNHVIRRLGIGPGDSGQVGWRSSSITWLIIQPITSVKCNPNKNSGCPDLDEFSGWWTQMFGGDGVPCPQGMCVLSHYSRVQLFTTPWTVARQAPRSLGFSRQEYWSGLPCPPPGDLPNSGTEPTSLTSPALAGEFFITSTT